MDRALNVLKKVNPKNHSSTSIGDSALSTTHLPRQSTDSVEDERRARSVGSPSGPNGTATGPRTDSRKNSTSHSPMRAIKHVLRRRSSSSNVDAVVNRDGEPTSKAQLRKLEKDQEREIARQHAQAHEEEDHRRKEEAEKRAATNETDAQRSKYGVLPINGYAGAETGEKRVQILDLVQAQPGTSVTFRARIHTIRRISAKLAFILFRQQADTIQGVLQEHGTVSEHFIYCEYRLNIPWP